MPIFVIMEIKESLRAAFNSLPDSPGVYQYYDKDGEILYVGKAKNLKKRVSSYFQKNHEYGKIHMLVKRIEKINFIVVQTEWDALLLENSLIKKHQPHYNVMLKDDKTYPWICIKKEPYPRIFSTRKVIKDGSEYFGPYASGRMMHAMLEFVNKLYPLRNCNLVLTEENIAKKKFKKCLEYHLGNCKGPCEALQTKEDYDESIAQIRLIIKGNIQGAIKYLKSEIEIHAAKLEFEKAHELKEKLDMMERYQSKSMVVSPTIDNVDVFSIVADEKCGYVNYLKVMNGAIVQSHTIELSKKLDETPEDLLLLGIAELRQRFESQSPEIIIPFATEAEVPNAKFFVPQIGDKKRLLELSENNLRYYIKEKDMQESLKSPKTKTEALMELMQKDLRLKEPPVHIECFDNSNIQGAFPVAAMTVFKDGKPSKRDYRHFNIRTVEGPDDFASMEEVIYRRYKHVVEHNESMPQLIVIDGGKGQLSSAMESLTKLGLENKVAIIGIAKRLEEIFFPGDPIPLYLDKRSQTLRVIQQIRDEAHRFGITHHRKRRSKGAIKSALTEIKGVGEKTTEKLLSHFGSIERIKAAGQDEIAKVIGAKNAQLVNDFLNKEEKTIS